MALRDSLAAQTNGHAAPPPAVPALHDRTCKTQRLDRPVKKGNEFQRCWRLYEFCRASNGPDSDLLIRHWHVSSISGWYS